MMVSLHAVIVKESKANSMLATSVTFRTTLKQIALWTHPQATSAGRKKSRETDRRALQAGKRAAFSFSLFLSLSYRLYINTSVAHTLSHSSFSLLSLTLIHLSLRCKSSLSSSTSAQQLRGGGRVDVKIFGSHL